MSPAPRHPGDPPPPRPPRPPNPLVIDQPGLVPRRLRLLWGSVTVAFWALWFYLWSPLLTLLAWFISLRLGYQQIQPTIPDGRLLEALVSYLQLASILAGSLVVWAFYQFWRFHGLERRLAGLDATAQGLSRSSLTDGAPSAEAIGQWQHERRLRVMHDAQGHVSGVEPLGMPQPIPTPPEVGTQ